MKANGKIIGSIKADYIDNNLLFNYAIDSRYKNKGYMTETLKRVIEYFFNEVNINKVYSACCIENIASKKVMEKSGMICDGIIKEYVKLCDRYHDCYIYKLENK